MSKFIFGRLAVAAAVATFTAFSATVAVADGSHGHMAGIGAPGKAGDVSRTVNVVMNDNFFEPEKITLKEGETVRFVVANKGTLVHEFNIATAEMHRKHAPEMMMMVEHGVLLADRIDLEAAKKMQAAMGHGMHEEGNSLLLEPGKSGEMIWKFPKHATLEFACNVPGHYDAGMMGKIEMKH